MKNAVELLQHYLASEIDPAFALRARLLFDAVVRKQPRRILDVGCGRGFYVQALATFDFVERIDGIELEPTYLAQAISAVNRSEYKQKIVLQQGSVYALPFKSNSIDLVVLSEVLEHLPDEDSALQEIRRVLKPGGWLICTVPSQDFPFLWDPLNWVLMRILHTHVSKDIWWLAGIWAGHHRLYRAPELVTVMRRNHFTIRSYHSVVSHCWYATHFWLYGVGKNLVERCGWKSFSRFNVQQNRPVARVLASFMSLPEKLFGQWLVPLQLKKTVAAANIETTPSANHFVIAES